MTCPIYVWCKRKKREIMAAVCSAVQNDKCKSCKYYEDHQSFWEEK